MKEIDVMGIISPDKVPQEPLDEVDDEQSITQLSTISPQSKAFRKGSKENPSTVNIEHNQMDTMVVHHTTVSSKSAATPLSATGYNIISIPSNIFKSHPYHPMPCHSIHSR